MSFDTDLPIKNQSLDKRIVNIFKEQAQILLHELKTRKLEVILTPAPDPHHSGHKIRTVANTNPEWYRDLYWYYHPNFRRDRTLKSLNRLSKLEDKQFRNIKYKYDAIMRELIYDILVKGYSSDGYSIYKPDKIVKKYFKKNNYFTILE